MNDYCEVHREEVSDLFERGVAKIFIIHHVMEKERVTKKEAAYKVETILYEEAKNAKK
jgi:hypothetical protein